MQPHSRVNVYITSLWTLMTQSYRTFCTGGLAFGVVLLAFGWWVWPTRYRSLPLTRPPSRVLAARQDRLTGEVDLLTATGWHRLGRSRAPASTRMDSTEHPSTRMDSTEYDPLDGYRPDWRGYIPAKDTVLRLNVAPRR